MLFSVGSGRRSRDWSVDVVRYFLGTLEPNRMANLALQCDSFAATDREGLSPLAATVLSQFDGPLRSQARQLARAHFLEQGRYQVALAALARRLRQHQLSAVLLKGAGLLQTVYRTNPGVRPLGDIDLLLRGPDCDALRRALGRGNAKNSDPGQYTLEGVALDLHVDLLNLHRLPARACAFDLDPEAFFASSLPLGGPLEGLRVPEPVCQFLHLSVHALKHSHCRLFWLVDQALVLRLCPLPELLARARQTRTERPLAYSLELLGRLFEIRRPFQPCLSWLERAYLDYVCSRPGPNFWGEVVTSLSIPGIANRLTYLGQLLWPHSGEGFWARVARRTGRPQFRDSSSSERLSTGSQDQGR